MIRDRLKKVARRAAVKIFHMEFEVEERDPSAATVGHVGDIDESVIPRVVDGDGDTPGPKHKFDIGRTWLAAQIVSGESPFLVDIRTPAECVAGVLPDAFIAPGQTIRQHLENLPPADRRVTVYDQTGDLGSAEVAAWLRENGWPLARRLQGGYAEWLEHGEPIAVPTAPQGAEFGPGAPVQ
ncbi:MAG: rhodanese-like domain-containing protein, partial [Oligoflexia bacterium]|nr:rhodanese-like domain-containing protein [Oligoflexia bacterium]